MSSQENEQLERELSEEEKNRKELFLKAQKLFEGLVNNTNGPKDAYEILYMQIALLIRFLNMENECNFLTEQAKGQIIEGISLHLRNITWESITEDEVLPCPVSFRDVNNNFVTSVDMCIVDKKKLH